MHTASSTWILPRERRSADFSTSRATVPKQHSRLKTYKQNKKIVSLHHARLPYHPIFICLSACLHPPVSVKTLTKPLPPYPSLTLHCITSIPPSAPAACSGCFHFVLSSHPSILKSSYFSSLLPAVLFVQKTSIHRIPPSILPISTGFIWVLHTGTAVHRSCSSGLRWILQISVHKLHFVFFYHFVYYCQRL